MYSYDLRSGVKGASILDTSRDFCRVLSNSNKYYSRKEIETMSSRFGYNVWEMRGGWMTKKGTNVHLPFCRHIWQAHKVKRK